MLLTHYLHTSLPTYLGTSLPMYLTTYIPHYLRTSLPTYLTTYVPHYLRTSLPTYQTTYVPHYLCTSLLMNLTLVKTGNSQTPFLFIFVFSNSIQSTTNKNCRCIWFELPRTCACFDSDHFANCCTTLQCDQIGPFLKVLGNKFSSKSNQNILLLYWAILKRIAFK